MAQIPAVPGRRSSGDFVSARLDEGSSTPVGGLDDRDIIAAIAAGDPAGMAATYDSYAAALYGYCHWMLRQPTAAAEALQDTFVIAATVIAAITPGDLPEAPKLRPWLYAVARNECLRRLRTPPPADADEADAPDQRAETAGQQVNVADEPADATLRMRAIRDPIGVTYRHADATLPMRPVRQPAGATYQIADATLPMRGPPGDRHGRPPDQYERRPRTSRLAQVGPRRPRRVETSRPRDH